MNKEVQAIRAEIERLLKNEDTHGYACDSVTEALQCILAFIDSLPEEKPRKDLEEAYRKWVESHNDGDVLYCKKAFIAGAEWQKRQMLEDAVDCDVVAGSDGGKHLLVFIPDSMPMIDALKIGDKVKTIIVKEDEK